MKFHKKISEFDWLNFINTFGIPTVIALSTLVLSIVQWNSERQNRLHSIVADYFDDMTQLQLDSDLIERLPKQPFENTPESEAVRQLARAKTLVALRQLGSDGERKGQLLKFLYEAKLIANQCEQDSLTLTAGCATESVLPLSTAKLEDVKLEPPIPLKGIALESAFLAKANLREIDLTEADIDGADLTGADLTGAILSDAQMKRADLTNSTLVNAFLLKTNFSNANLRNANLQKADLRGAILHGASLEGTDLRGAKYNDSTEFPKGFDARQAGMKLCPPRIEDTCQYVD